MNNAERVARIEQLLRDKLTPAQIVVLDESHLHAGHEGAKSGKGHFFVSVKSSHFRGLSLLARHRMIYAAMGSMMDTDIHALRIDAQASET